MNAKTKNERAMIMFMIMQENHAIKHNHDCENDIVFDSYCRTLFEKFIKTCNDCEGIFIVECDFCIDHSM